MTTLRTTSESYDFNKATTREISVQPYRDELVIGYNDGICATQIIERANFLGEDINKCVEQLVYLRI
ncbi:MAG: hypothetical protein KFBDDELM_00269 [Candidatus Argoarchaeum ethanivorans]|uniref:Uncharacterized protein n=1 Tax=Candidatus Argoarchaeum ethanivorans TaxID=2608793 RepID=A0A811T0E8_9EURY|nr:MAG: hypothetical protein KFBDDELM_00269 [Candidatus Argoarchaeum ethanivorans]